MPTRVLFILVAVIAAAMTSVFLSNIAPRLAASKGERYIRLNDIRGTSVIHGGLEFPLNFAQQNEVALFLNNSVPATGSFSKSASVPFEKILIYVFNEPTIEVIPVGFEDNELIFYAPAWNADGALRDISRGALKQTLLNSYDA